MKLSRLCSRALEEGDKVWIREEDSVTTGELSNLVYRGDGESHDTMVELNDPSMASGFRRYKVSESDREYDDFGFLAPETDPEAAEGFIELMKGYGSRGEKLPEYLSSADTVADRLYSELEDYPEADQNLRITY